MFGEFPKRQKLEQSDTQNILFEEGKYWDINIFCVKMKEAVSVYTRSGCNKVFFEDGCGLSKIGTTDNVQHFVKYVREQLNKAGHFKEVINYKGTNYAQRVRAKAYKFGTHYFFSLR